MQRTCQYHGKIMNTKYILFILLALASSQHTTYAMEINNSLSLFACAKLVYSFFQPTRLYGLAASNDIAGIKKRLALTNNPNEADENNNSALHYAIARGHLASTIALITAGANTTTTNNLGRTPFAHACAHNQTACAHLLRAHHDTNEQVQDIHGNTPLMILALQDNPDRGLLNTLIASCPDLDYTNRFGNSVRELIGVHQQNNPAHAG